MINHWCSHLINTIWQSITPSVQIYCIPTYLITSTWIFINCTEITSMHAPFYLFWLSRLFHFVQRHDNYVTNTTSREAEQAIMPQHRVPPHASIYSRPEVAKCYCGLLLSTPLHVRKKEASWKTTWKIDVLHGQEECRLSALGFNKALFQQTNPRVLPNTPIIQSMVVLFLILVGAGTTLQRDFNVMSRVWMPRLWAGRVKWGRKPTNVFWDTKGKKKEKEKKITRKESREAFRIKIPTPEVRELMVTVLPHAGSMARANTGLVPWPPEARWLGSPAARVPKGQWSIGRWVSWQQARQARPSDSLAKAQLFPLKALTESKPFHGTFQFSLISIFGWKSLLKENFLPTHLLPGQMSVVWV